MADWVDKFDFAGPEYAAADGMIWGAAVQTHADLPSVTADGETRFVEDEDSIYTYHQGQWIRLGGNPHG
jgi:hypothetical protein